MIRGAGRYSTLITPTAGSLFHAEFHRARASQLLPHLADCWKAKGAHGRAEAALLALYGAKCLLPYSFTASPLEDKAHP